MDTTKFVYNPINGVKFDQPVSHQAFELYSNSLKECGGNAVWGFNPYTGDQRYPLDVVSDPFGRALVKSFVNIKVPNKEMKDDMNTNTPTYINVSFEIPATKDNQKKTSE
jgi:hypothetical protein